MTGAAPPAGAPLRCCFCNGEIPLGDATESLRLAFMDLEPGAGAAAFLARTQQFYCHAGCFRQRLHDPAALLPFQPEPDDVVHEERVREACAELAAELVTRAENDPFRERLFASPAGRWVPVADLCSGLPLPQQRLAELRDHAGGEVVLLAQHAPHPLDEDGEYALVVFAEPGLLWTMAVTTLRDVRGRTHARAAPAELPVADRG